MIKIKIHPLFVALIVTMIMLGHLYEFLNVIVALFVHELAHYRIAKARGYSFDKITLMPYGAVLSGNENISKLNACAVYLSGPIINLVLSLIIIAIWWLVPSTYGFSKGLVVANLYIGLFNLLPLYPLDGSKVIVNCFKNRKSALRIVKIIGIVISLLLFLLFIISIFFSFNIFLGIMAIFLFAGAYSQSNQAQLEHLLTDTPYYKDYNHGLKKQTICIPLTMPLYRVLSYIRSDTLLDFDVVDSKCNKVCHLAEDEMREIMENNELTAFICDIL